MRVAKLRKFVARSDMAVRTLHRDLHTFMALLRVAA